jgi:valyl-tRNA synthetase
MISGFALSAERGKISKSKEHNEIAPMTLIEQESADALRYWATAVRTGLDTPFQPDLLTTGRRLITKLWNASRFAERHLLDLEPEQLAHTPEHLWPTDRWLLSRLARTIAHSTSELERNEYATARAEVERFFWSDLCDNYLELIKARLYNDTGAARDAARWTLYHALLAVLKMLAPYLPYITETLYQGVFREREGVASIHIAAWPVACPEWISEEAEQTGSTLLALLQQVRRYKAEQNLSVGAEIAALRIVLDPALHAAISEALIDLKSATRAGKILLEEPGKIDDARMEEDQALWIEVL